MTGAGAFIQQSKAAELPVVLLEDSAALVGLGCALLGVTLSFVTADARFDALGSLGIGILLVVVALTLASEMKSLLIGESAAEEDVVAARHVLERDHRVDQVLDLRTEQLGPDEIMVGAKVVLRDGIDTVDITSALEEMEDAIRAEVPTARRVYLAPTRPRPTDG